MKPVAEQGLGPDYVDVAQRLDIRPRKPTHLPKPSAVWANARVGRISLPVDVAANFDHAVGVFLFTPQIGMRRETACAIFRSVFGNANVHASPSGKGWWMTYAPGDAGALQLHATFDNPKKGVPDRALFSGVLLTPR